MLYIKGVILACVSIKVQGVKLLLVMIMNKLWALIKVLIDTGILALIKFSHLSLDTSRITLSSCCLQLGSLAFKGL